MEKTLTITSNEAELNDLVSQLADVTAKISAFKLTYDVSAEADAPAETEQPIDPAA